MQMIFDPKGGVEAMVARASCPVPAALGLDAGAGNASADRPRLVRAEQA
jgi:hypothetical protein